MTTSLLWLATRAAGSVGVLLLTAVVALGCVSTVRRSGVGVADVVLSRVHRSVSLLAAGFIVLHVVTAIVDDYVPIGWAAALLPLASEYRPVVIGLGTVALDLLIAVIITGLLRHRIPERAFRKFHLLPYALWPIALLHGFLATTADRSWLAWMSLGCLAVGGAAIGWMLLNRNGNDRRQRRLVAGPLPEDSTAESRWS